MSFSHSQVCVLASPRRLRSLVAQLVFTGKINDELEPLDRPVDAKTFEIVNRAIGEFDAWLEEWDSIMGMS